MHIYNSSGIVEDDTELAQTSLMNNVQIMNTREDIKQTQSVQILPLWKQMIFGKGDSFF